MMEVPGRRKPEVPRTYRMMEVPGRRKTEVSRTDNLFFSGRCNSKVPISDKMGVPGRVNPEVPDIANLEVSGRVNRTIPRKENSGMEVPGRINREGSVVESLEVPGRVYREIPSLAKTEVSGRINMEITRPNTNNMECPVSKNVSNYCAPCKFTGMTKRSDGFCETCEIFLCNKCLDYHQKSKITKSHNILLGPDLLLGKRPKIYGFKRIPMFRDKICVSHTNDTNQNGPYITGLCFVAPELELLLIADCRNKALKLVDVTSKQITSTLGLTSEPSSVVRLPDDQAAVTLPTEKQIQIVLTRELIPVRGVKLSGQCCGIGYGNKKLIVSYYKPGTLEIIGMNGAVYKSTTHSSYLGIVFKNPFYLALKNFCMEKYIYVTDSASNTITKLNMDGEYIAKLEEERLCGPQDIVTLDENYLAVCSLRSNKISLICDNGEKLELSQQWDINSRPLAVEYSPLNRQLYVSSASLSSRNNIYVYQL